MRLFGLVLLSISLLTFSGCEDKDDAEIYKAQFCLDRAAPGSADVAACVANIQNQTSKQAYVLKCSADFLTAGIDEVKIVNAIENMDGDDNGSNPSTVLMDNLSFQTQTPIASNNTLAAQAVTNCSLSGSDTLKALAEMASVSTFMYVATGGGQTIEQFLQGCTGGSTCIDSIVTNGDDAAMAATVLSMQDTLCGENGMFKSEGDTCLDIQNATDSATKNPDGSVQNPEAFLEDLMNRFNTNS